MEGEGEPPVQAVQSHIYTRWMRLLGGWTSGFIASLDGCAPGLAGQDDRQWGSRSGFSLSQGHEERDRPGSMLNLSDGFAGKRSHRNRSSSPERVRLLQPFYRLYPRPQKRRQPKTYSILRLLFHALMKRSFRMITLKQILPQIYPGDWFMSLDLKDAYFHIQIAPPSQAILEIHIQRGGISIQSPAVWAIPGSPHFYTMHGCGSLPSASDGNPHTQMLTRCLLQGRYRPYAQIFPENTGPMGAASPVLQLGLLHMRPIQFWMKQRVPSAAWHHGRHRVTVTRPVYQPWPVGGTSSG